VSDLNDVDATSATTSVEAESEKQPSASDNSLAELEAKLSSDFPPADQAKAKLETAARDRKRARRTTKKQFEVVWEPADAASYRHYGLVVLLIFVVAVAIVIFTVFLK